MRKQHAMPTTPPPLPSWLDLITNITPEPETISIPRAELPCNRCGNGIRMVYKGGKIDAYCQECRREINHKSYLERNGRDIKIGSTSENCSLAGARKRAYVGPYDDKQ